ncbi:DUF6320 domain-containing protein [Pseudoflavonifractor phocaeensis]|uniref:DUF6320 domain-containing protein n=1 Tax=Pseudoflavonifractor phocaeensis TaxID=1870988 RepID=UPI00195A932F|nr:DUF6320 domain-containing protein [Pseudoflavonifractor phocaeensis]MBM6924511.1 zinc ribbon domain-containing protein [Pseudoflavonifractor phocaeensis]
MSYCVHCGVELDATAAFCPLCHTPVLDPGHPVDSWSPKPFPTQPGEVPPIHKRAMAWALTGMLACVAAGCGLLNLFLRPGRGWSLYVIGAVIMLWVWIVIPLLIRGIPLLLRSIINVAAVGLYVYLISLDLKGWNWYIGLAVPIILWGGAVWLLLSLMLRVYHRSAISAAAILLCSLGVFLVGVEFLIDRWLTGVVDLSWSLVVLTICVCVAVPLVIIRRIPAVREEVRRRFHM